MYVYLYVLNLCDSIFWKYANDMSYSIIKGRMYKIHVSVCVILANKIELESY